MPHLARREKRGLILLLLAGAVPLGIAGFFAYLEANPNIQIPARAAAPSPNGFDLYVEAANLSAQPNPPVDVSTDPSPPTTAATGAIRYGRARREAWHAGAAPAWQMFRQAQQTEARDPYGYGENMPGYARLRQLARDKNAETRLFQMRGESDKAVASALDCVEMAYDISQGGALISRLVGTAICAIGIAPLSETLAPNAAQTPEQLSGPQAREAAARLEALLARRPSYVEAVKNARWDALALLDKAFKRGDWRAPGTFNFSGNTPKLEAPSKRMARALISKGAVVANINRSFDEAIVNAKAPYAPQPQPQTERDDLDPISASLALSGNPRFNAAREKTQLDLLLLRLALQAYRMEKGAYPPTLGALKGAYLKQIPTDDFSGGKPYFYALKNGDYRLWSVGPDAVNDGGKAIGPLSEPIPPPISGPVLPWNRHLPSILLESKGDAVARETR